MNERRRHPRLHLDRPVTLRHRGRLIPATLKDVSTGGMRLAADSRDIQPDFPVEVIFDLEDRHDLSVRGRIVHLENAKKTSFGIRFSNLFSPGHKVIEKFVLRHEQDQA